MQVDEDDAHERDDELEAGGEDDQDHFVLALPRVLADQNVFNLESLRKVDKTLNLKNI